MQLLGVSVPSPLHLQIFESQICHMLWLFCSLVHPVMQQAVDAFGGIES